MYYIFFNKFTCTLKAAKYYLANTKFDNYMSDIIIIVIFINVVNKNKIMDQKKQFLFI